VKRVVVGISLVVLAACGGSPLAATSPSAESASTDRKALILPGSLHGFAMLDGHGPAGDPPVPRRASGLN
jgi:hypothetical protein